MNFRVLMQDQELGFKFAMTYEVFASRTETLAQYGISEEESCIENAKVAALMEFPDAFIVEVKQVMKELVMGGFETEYLGTY